MNEKEFKGYMKNFSDAGIKNMRIEDCFDYIGLQFLNSVIPLVRFYHQDFDTIAKWLNEIKQERGVE